jgi:hypothetical protein
MTDIIAFSRKYKLNLITIQDIQNISLFGIACSSFCSYLYYNICSTFYENNLGNEYNKPFDLLLPIVGLHAFADFFLTKSIDLKLHHICIFGIIFYNNYNNVSQEDRFIFLYPLLKTEISSIFYVLKYWLPQKTMLYNVNTILFYLSFLKLRIYDFYYEIIYNNVSFDIIFKKYSYSNYYLSSILLISCYGLYILNLYWFLIMNKILYKTITKIINNINTDILCHNLCSYLHWINIPLSFYIYSNNPNEKNMIDMAGISILSMSSFMYHNDIYKRLYYKKIEEYIIPNKDNIILFINDSIAINIRSFLVVFTNYYNSKYLLFVLFISFLLHILSIYHSNINILKLFINYDKNKDTFFNIHNLNIALPIGCDVFLIFINSPIEIAIPFLLVNIIIIFLFLIEPFYKLTHVFFHILLIVQNYYMCLSNIN